jgi:hypothetical protein
VAGAVVEPKDGETTLDAPCAIFRDFASSDAREQGFGVEPEAAETGVGARRSPDFGDRAFRGAGERASGAELEATETDNGAPR